MWGVRGCLLTCFAVLALAGPLTAARGVLPRVPELTEAGNAALDKGLAWLVKHQQPGGSWIADVGYKLNSGYIVDRRRVRHVGITALAGLALLWSGRDPAGKELQAALSFVMRCESPDGDGMVARDRTRLYSHGLATLFLSEMARVTGDGKVVSAAQRAAKYVWASQCRSGGWGYAPNSERPDMTVTAYQILALRAAKCAGLRVPKVALDRAVHYVMQSANIRGSDEGSFKYQYRRRDQIPTRNSFPISAAGFASLLGAGLDTDFRLVLFQRKDGLVARGPRPPPPRIASCLRSLRNSYATTVRRHYFFYFGNFFAVQAMHMAGGSEWTEYFARVQRDLVEDQEPEGHWPDRHVGPAFATASSCLILLVPRVPPVPALTR